jgi:pimeloyl-ACP methyl ester carboxylesterase
LKSLEAVIFGVFFFTACACAGQEFHVGFKVIKAYDSSRIYKPTSDVAEKLHYRPIEIDLWYPADVNSNDTTASFVDLIRLLEQRSNFYDDTRTYNGLTEEMLQYICAGTDCPDYNLLKNIKTDSYIEASGLNRAFPLIVYFTGLNGMSYENYRLFEALARNGFMVASVSSIGRYPGNMTMELEDLLEQIRDGEFIIRYLTKTNKVSEEVGLIGYSWGGLASAILAMTNPTPIKAIVSLDGSEQFAYLDKEENEKLNRIQKSDVFKPNAISSPYLYLDSEIPEQDNLPDSIYDITSHIADAYYLKINHSAHEDFSSLSILSKQAQGDTTYHVIQQLVIDFLLDKMKGKDVFENNVPDNRVTRRFSQPASPIANGITGSTVFKGILRDKKSNLPLPYVNIGVVNKDIGTTSDAKGAFALQLTELNINDTIRISMVGFVPKVIFVKDIFLRSQQSHNIQLLQETHKLNEIVVVEKKLSSQVLGNKTDSKFFGGKFASGDLGSEIAIRIKIKHPPTYLDSFSFNISYNTGDTAAFRVNIYEAINGLPGKNILSKNIILKITGQTGKVNVDLSEYNLVVTDDFFVALEWIEGDNNSGIVFSAGFVNKGTYYRKASQGRWKKHAMGVGFNVTAKY